MGIKVFCEDEARTRQSFLGADEKPLGLGIGEKFLQRVFALGGQELDEVDDRGVSALRHLLGRRLKQESGVAVPLFGLVGQSLRYHRQRVTLEVVLVAQLIEDAPGLRPLVEWIE